MYLIHSIAFFKDHSMQLSGNDSPVCILISPCRFIILFRFINFCVHLLDHLCRISGLTSEAHTGTFQKIGVIDINDDGFDDLFTQETGVATRGYNGLTGKGVWQVYYGPFPRGLTLPWSYWYKDYNARTWDTAKTHVFLGTNDLYVHGNFFSNQRYAQRNDNGVPTVFFGMMEVFNTGPVSTNFRPVFVSIQGGNFNSLANPFIFDASVRDSPPSWFKIHMSSQFCLTIGADFDRNGKMDCVLVYHPSTYILYDFLTLNIRSHNWIIDKFPTHVRHTMLTEVGTHIPIGMYDAMLMDFDGDKNLDHVAYYKGQFSYKIGSSTYNTIQRQGIFAFTGIGDGFLPVNGQDFKDSQISKTNANYTKHLRVVEDQNYNLFAVFGRMFRHGDFNGDGINDFIYTKRNFQATDADKLQGLIYGCSRPPVPSSSSSSSSSFSSSSSSSSHSSSSSSSSSNTCPASPSVKVTYDTDLSDQTLPSVAHLLVEYQDNGNRIVPKEGMFADLNDDGIDDLIYKYSTYTATGMSYGAGVLVIFGSRQYSTPRSLRLIDASLFDGSRGFVIRMSGLQSPTRMISADADGDGTTDLIMLLQSGHACNVQYAQCSAILIFYGKKGAQFSDSYQEPTIIEAGNQDFTRCVPSQSGSNAHIAPASSRQSGHSMEQQTDLFNTAG